MKELQVKYNEWRKLGEEQSTSTDIPFTWDCGEASAREDFSNYAELEKEITFEEMLKLEENY